MRLSTSSVGRGREGIPVGSEVDKGQQGLQSAIRAIVLDALAKGPGATLTKNTDLRTTLGVSAGTAQRALDVLAERGALRTVSRGHLGRRIEEVSVGECWQAAGLSPLRVTLSPGGAIEMDALESTLGEELTAAGIPHTVSHLPGGMVRASAVAAGTHDLTVISSGTLESYQGAAESAWPGPSRALGPGTYYAPGRVVAVWRAQESSTTTPRNVAVDPTSPDHVALTTAEFASGRSISMMEVPFPDVPAYVLAGLVDAGVWHIANSAIPVELAGLRLEPLRAVQSKIVLGQLSRAVLAGSGRRPEILSVIDAIELTGLDRSQELELESEANRLAPLRIVRDRMV